MLLIEQECFNFLRTFLNKYRNSDELWCIPTHKTAHHRELNACNDLGNIRETINSLMIQTTDKSITLK